MAARPPTLLSDTRGGRPRGIRPGGASGRHPLGGGATVGYSPMSPLVEVGVDAPAAPGGLPWSTVSVSDMRQYIAAVDESARSLDDDQYATIVYDDPDALQTKIDAEKEWGTVSPAREAQVAVLREREKTRSAAQVAREEDWGAKWRDVFGRWQKVKAVAGYPGDMDAASTGKWYQVRDVHKEINLAHDGYEDGGGEKGSGVGLGYTATLKKKAEVVPKGPGDIIDSGVSYVPWIIAGGVVVGIVLLLGSVKPFLA